MTIEYKDSKRIITYPTEYKVHSFTSDGTFQITSGSGNVEYLVVAGGGGGGGAGNTPAGSGGGAGGMLTGTVSKSTGTHTVTVGTGGTGGGTSGDGIFGNNGGNSVFDSITSSGGGGGGAYNGNSNLASSEAQDGGSGGGASWASWSGSEGVGISGQGNDGGNNSDSSSGSLQGGSGGGGAGDVGTAGGGNGGNGGIGLQSSITGTTTYYAGGGYGGIGNGVGSVGTAGDGLIGQGGYGGNYNGNNGGTGADGIVIVRYVDDGSITATGGTITTISEAVTKPTDVQDNSILVEKDTARRYWFDADASYTTVEAGATADSNGGAAYVTYKQITGLTAGDEISHVTFDVYNTPTDTSFKGGVYTESSSNPTTLLASGELTNQNVSNTYTTLSIPLTSNATVPSNGIVWVAIIPNKTNPLLRVSTASSSYTNSKFSTTTGSYTNYSNWMLSTASVQGAGENNVRFGVKIYHAPVWTMQPTSRSDFTSTPLDSESSAEISYNPATDVVDFHLDGNSVNNSGRGTIDVQTAIGQALSDKWVAEFDINTTAIVDTNSTRMTYFFGFTSQDQDIPTTNVLGIVSDLDSSPQRDDLGLTASDSADSDPLTTDVTNLDTNPHYYIRLIRDGNTLNAEYYTDSARTILFASGTLDISSFDNTGLRYFGIWDDWVATGSVNTHTGTWSEFAFYNGVTSIN